MSFLPLNKNISSVLLKNYQEIKNDYLNLSESDFSDFLSVEQVLYDPKNTGYFWQVCLLIWNKETNSHLPQELKDSKTIEVLNSLEIRPTVAVFSKILPGGHIEKHGDYDDVYIEKIPEPEEYQYRPTGLIKYHLALDVPQDGECAIIVEGNKKVIQNGDIYSFDEGTVHEAYNCSDKSRGVLIVSFMKRDLGIND